MNNKCIVIYSILGILGLALLLLVIPVNIKTVRTQTINVSDSPQIKVDHINATVDYNGMPSDWADSDYTEDGCDEPATYLGRSTDDLGEMFWSTYTLDGAEVFTESQLEELKKENPLLAPAVDVMKELVEEEE